MLVNRSFKISGYNKKFLFKTVFRSNFANGWKEGLKLNDHQHYLIQKKIYNIDDLIAIISVVPK